ncbi:hypothetical protein [Microseira sp. BLCC-F43]|jgi:hypothetical protein|uniref:hypothetical protein n=1 Tax=Microseira sp. BLCC-F43 TaxID=3153602 RepID=UPI0035B9F731
MQVLENIAVSSATTCETYLTKIQFTSEAKLYMVWVKKIDNEGREHLVAEWQFRN